MTEHSRLLRATEAAAYLGVSKGMLTLSRHTGELFKGVESPPFLKLGSAVRYHKEDLDQWISSQPKYANTAEFSMRSMMETSV
jgi:predicted DNA-binding transcriptional regulator AlpA